MTTEAQKTALTKTMKVATSNAVKAAEKAQAAQPKKESK